MRVVQSTSRGVTWAVWLTRLALLVGFIAVWEFLSDSGAIDPFFWGAPSGIGAFFRTWANTTLWDDLIATLEEVFVGLATGVVGGVLLGIVLGLAPFWRRVLHPFVDMANSTPRIALAPLFTLWLGIGLISKVAVVVSIVFFIMMINTMEGVLAVDEDYLRLLRILGATRIDEIRYVVLPASVAWIKAGMRLAIPYAVAGAVIGEFVAADKGLGYRLVQQSGNLNTNGVLAAVVVLAVLGAGFSLLSNQLLSDTGKSRPKHRQRIEGKAVDAHDLESHVA